jgi:hypothetical protein
LLKSSQSIEVEHRDVCIALCDLVVSWGRGVSRKRLHILGGFLNNVDVGKLLLRAELPDKSLCHCVVLIDANYLCLNLPFRVCTRSTLSKSFRCNHYFEKVNTLLKKAGITLDLKFIQ